MSGTLVTVEMTEIKHVSNVKKGNHSLPLCQNIVNGIYVTKLNHIINGIEWSASLVFLVAYKIISEISLM
jgi:hypothetical protein